MSVLAIVGCSASILPLYEEARQSALADPGPAPASWDPDAIVRLSDDSLKSLVRAAVLASPPLAKGIRAPIAGVEAKIDLDLSMEELTLAPSRACPACLDVTAKMGGRASWSLGPAQGSAPVEVSAGMDIRVGVTKIGEEWAVSLRAADVRDLRVVAGGKQKSAIDLGPMLDRQLTRRLVAETPEIEVGRFGSAGLPLRALRVAADEGGLSIEALTASPSPGRVDPPAAPSSGFRAALSQTSLLALARRRAFEAGEVGHGIVADPSSLSVAGEDFTLGLRLWRPSGRGWWRDYRVAGRLEAGPRGIALRPSGAEQLGQSPGADWADPLVALAEGRVLEAVREGAETMLPLRRQEVGGVVIAAALAKIDGRGDVLLAEGTLTATRRSR